MSEQNNKNTQKWTEIEHLPEWDEEYYDVYTAKKFGKWVMLKTLKPQFKDDPRFESMIEKEFDVRYNLAHPHIVMINDYEEVSGLGKCIITDDVYGDSLAKLLREKKVGAEHVEKICTQLVDALDYIQRNHIVHFPVRPETIIFTENIGNLKLIDVGFDQREHLTPADAEEDIYNFGKVLSTVLEQVPDAPAHLKRIAAKCLEENPRRRYPNIHSLRLDIVHRSDNKIYLAVIIFLILMIGLLVWFNSPWAPVKPDTATGFINIFTSQWL